MAIKLALPRKPTPADRSSNVCSPPAHFNTNVRLCQANIRTNVCLQRFSRVVSVGKHVFASDPALGPWWTDPREA